MNHYAIFGGTFDPVHCGHVALVQYVLSYMHDTMVIISCAYQNPHKAQNIGGAHAQHRLAMIKSAFGRMNRVIIDESEIRERGISYTVDMLMRFRKVYNDVEKMYFIIGSDLVEKIHQWKNVQEIANLVTLLIYPRFDENLSYDNGTSLHRALHACSFEYVWMDSAPRLDISSTDIRIQYKKNRLKENVLPPSVHEYIRQHSLYT